ncbi:hypothetical protein DIE28_02745 [Paracoccus thiocyanatus]|uniref:Concanavalin A-like lectin/glucanases superfamily protein n=1 Tax=Paracoccus thiocyanatus TaxID=34006 RepID=A0A3D8PEF3_9RHOB|nr:hypothetical protein DIE28_02745 [Paracoccus thiocyanatus]
MHSSRGLQFFNSETYEPDARLQLEGDPLGDPAAISIAVDAQIADGQTGVDQQTLWGNSQPPARLMYRSGNGGHLLLQWGGNVPPYIMTLPLPAGHAGRIRALMTISSTTVTLRVHDAVPVSMAYPGPVSLPLFYLASSSNSQITLRGYIRRFGIWKSSLTASEIETVMRWIS